VGWNQVVVGTGQSRRRSEGVCAQGVVIVVKKSSFLDKLKSRLRHSDVQLEPAEPAERRGAAAPERGASRVDPVPVARPVDVEAVPSRKMSQREEATVAIQDGFRELTSLLRGMQNRVEDQGERFTRAADGIAQLPALQEAQLEMLRRIADRMQAQDQSHALMAQSLGGLPELMGQVREALDRAAATDDRTANTLGEFRSNMDRIQSSMAEMVDHSRRHATASEELVQGRGDEVRELTDSLSEVQREAVDRLESTQRDGVRALRDAHADQAKRLGRMVEEGQKTNRAVLILLGLTFLALMTIAIALLQG
jgi:methyl-accepting chemotaxis protein